MNTSSHVEDMITGLKTFLLANLGTYLTTVVAAKADGVALPAPVSTSVVLGAMDVAGYSKYPVVFLVPIGETYEPLTPSTDLITATVSIMVLVGGTSDDALNKQTWRYGAMIRNLLRDYPTWGGTVEMSKVKEVVYFPEVQGESGLKAVRVTVEAEKELS